jgi:hypothetical protein
MPSALLGREAELLRLEASLERAQSGSGAFVAVGGPAGIGKTRLLAEFAISCQSRGLTVLSSCGARPEVEPYAAWRPIVAGLGNGPPASSPAYASALARLAAPAAARRKVPPPLPAEQARYRLYDAVRERLAAVAGRVPIVVILDNAESLDEPSVRLLRHLLPFVERMPVLVAIAYDDRLPSRSRLAGLAVPPSLSRDHLLLSGLPADHVTELLRRRGLSPDAALTAARLHEITHGAPLHLELIADLLDSGCMTRADTDHLALSAGSPERAVALIAGGLSPHARLTLAAATVFGDGFTVAEVGALAEVANVTVALSEATAAGLLGEDGELRHFRHGLIRRVIAESVDSADRMRLERRAAERAARRGAACPAWRLGIWYHASRALPGAEAGVAACLAAAQQAEADSAPEVKVAALRMAADLAGMPARVGLLSNLARAAAEAGEAAEAADAARRAVALLDAQPRMRRRTGDLLTAAAVALHDGGAEESIWRPLQQAAYRRLGGRRDIRWALLRLLEPGSMRKIAGPPLQVGRWLGLDRRAVRIARDRGDEADYCRTLLVYDWLSVADVDALLARARRWHSPAVRARALSVAAETLMYRHGAFDRACRLLRLQLALHEAQGSIVEQAKSLVRLTMAELAAGELRRAVATRARARDMVARLGPGYLIYEHAGTRRGGDLYPEISMESNFAWYLEGDWEAVAKHWVRAIALEEPGGSPVHIVEAAMAAQAYARLGRFADAKLYLEALTPVLQRLKPRDWAVNGAVGRASHAIWDMVGVEYAAAYRALALALLEAGVGDWTNTSLELTVARMAALLGSGAEAEEYFRRARRRLGRRRQDPRRAIIDYDEVIALRLLSASRGERRSHLLDAALATFRACGMQGWVQRATAESERGAA